MIEIFRLEQLEAFSRLGTLTAAANELHISQPALTHSMKKLEEEFGVALFNRDSRRISLNSTGNVAADYARRILEDERQMMQATLNEDRKQNIITVDACTLLGTEKINALVRQYFSDKSIMTEVADDGVMINRLKNRTCQLALLHHLPNDKHLLCQYYGNENACISLPQDHPLAKKSKLTADDLAGLSILAFNIGFWIPVFKENLPKSLIMVQTDRDTMDSLVESPDLLVFNTDRLVENDYVLKGRVNVPVDESFAHADLYLACLRSEKERYQPLFNAVRVKALRQKD